MIDLIYFGTSDYSIILLEALKKSPDVNLKLVITKPDKPTGRHQEMHASPVKKWCIENAIQFITPASLKKELPKVKTKIQEQNVKIGAVADYGLIIPKELIDTFEKVLINIHFSLLPKYRGACPVTYTILNGDKETGISFLFTVSEMDKGDIIKQIPYSIIEKETDESLYQKLFKLASEKLVEVLNDYIKGKLTPKKQDESKATYTTPSGKFDRTTYVLKEDAKIDWSKDAAQIEQMIRAYYPWPIAWTTLGECSQYLKRELKVEENKDLRVKIYEAHLAKEKEGVLVIDKIQVEGKKMMSFIEFENGYLKK